MAPRFGYKSRLQTTNSLALQSLRILVSLSTLSCRTNNAQWHAHCSAYCNDTTMKSFNVLVGFIAAIGFMSVGTVAMPVSVARR